ncbi:hypothetical protein AB0I91_19170 [Actinosynnema sp. NPDC049800]
MDVEVRSGTALRGRPRQVPSQRVQPADDLVRSVVPPARTLVVRGYRGHEPVEQMSLQRFAVQAVQVSRGAVPILVHRDGEVEAQRIAQATREAALGMTAQASHDRLPPPFDPVRLS